MNGLTTDLYFDLKDKENHANATILQMGIKSLCKIHIGHLFLLQIYSPVKCEALFRGKSCAGLASMNLGELEDGVSTAEQLLEVLGDNNEEEEDAENVEATLHYGLRPIERCP